MNVQKFFAATTRDALRKVRDELGPDAIILANKPVPGGVEIMAVAELDVNNIAGRGAPPPAPAPNAQPSRAIQSIVDNKTREARLLVEAEFHAAHAPAAEPSLSGPAPAPVPVSAAVEPPAAQDSTPDAVVQDIVRELRFLRGMVEGQLAGFAWGDMQRRSCRASCLTACRRAATWNMASNG
jgi:flagellar biosynthesis protein FlhF